MFHYCKNDKGSGHRKKIIGVAIIMFLIVQLISARNGLIDVFAANVGVELETETDIVTEEKEEDSSIEEQTEQISDKEEQSSEKTITDASDVDHGETLDAETESEIEEETNMEEPSSDKEEQTTEKDENSTTEDQTEQISEEQRSEGTITDVSDVDHGETLDTETESEIEEETNIEEQSSYKEKQTTEEEKDTEETDLCSSLVEVEIPIYTLDIVNVVVPAAYQIAFNPYGFPVSLNGSLTSNAQILSKNYGIVNKSSQNMLVTVELTVEDLNSGVIRFVDSSEEAENADTGIYAVYLALVPADGNEIKVGDNDVNLYVTREELSDISMTGVTEKAIALHEGTNIITFRLSKAVYDIMQQGQEMENIAAELISLAPDGKGVTAFTFSGAANKNADWMELSQGIRISAVYTYEIADGSEKIVEGTGAMISAQ